MSQRILEAVNPGGIEFPMRSITEPSPPRTSMRILHSSTVLVSFQSFAGLITFPSESKGIRLCC